MPELPQDVLKPPSRPNSVKVKVIVILVVVLAILLSAASVFWMQQKKSKPSPTSSSKETAIPKYDTKFLTSEEIIKLLPANIPLEKDALILQSSLITDKDGTEQITYQFITKKTLEENFSLYKTYLEKNGWKIQNTVNEVEIKSLSSNKEKEQKNLIITISKNTITSQNIVDISLISPASIGSLLRLSFPEISGKVIISESELPLSFQDFIKHSTINGIEVEKLNYVNKTTGFLITGIMSNISLLEIESKYKEFSQKNKWELINNIRTEKFSFFEYKGKDFEMKISCKLKQKNVEVKIQSIITDITN